jgi:hypothetical protein
VGAAAAQRQHERGASGRAGAGVCARLNRLVPSEIDSRDAREKQAE